MLNAARINAKTFADKGDLAGKSPESHSFKYASKPLSLTQNKQGASHIRNGTHFDGNPFLSANFY
jgi:hypothetical protein